MPRVHSLHPYHSLLDSTLQFSLSTEDFFFHCVELILLSFEIDCLQTSNMHHVHCYFWVDLVFLFRRVYYGNILSSPVFYYSIICDLYTCSERGQAKFLLWRAEQHVLHGHQTMFKSLRILAEEWILNPLVQTKVLISYTFPFLSFRGEKERFFTLSTGC